MSAAPASGLHSQGRCLTSIISILEKNMREASGILALPEKLQQSRRMPCVVEGAPEARWLHQIHFNCNMTVPSEIVGRATPVLLAFLAIHSRAARVLSSAPALSW